VPWQCWWWEWPQRFVQSLAYHTHWRSFSAWVLARCLYDLTQDVTTIRHPALMTWPGHRMHALTSILWLCGYAVLVVLVACAWSCLRNLLLASSAIIFLPILLINRQIQL
jgi:hypothetical protein